jgi:hypothetical protein
MLDAPRPDLARLAAVARVTARLTWQQRILPSNRCYRFHTQGKRTRTCNTLRSLTNRMLRKLSGKNEPHCRLNLARGNSRFLRIRCELCTTGGHRLLPKQNKSDQNDVLLASVAILSNKSFTNEFRTPIPLFDIPVSGWTCLSTKREKTSAS